MLGFSATPALAIPQSILGNKVHGGATQFVQFTNGFGVNQYSDVHQPGQIVNNIINILFGLLGIVAVVLIMYGGFLWLTAAGEEDKAQQGTKLIFQAFIGLAIILAAYMLAYFILAQLTAAIAT